ncbi:phage tail protein [Vibrio sp. St2]|uniref:phage tail protein n=1 Tax=Vibrio sp. St2 TaxID=2853441 RepID=UPI00248D59AC|nr:phage tail protein [Vibrio sp. St2]
MSAVQNLKTVVTLGGAVDNSFSQMGGVVDKELGKATKQVKTLEKEQKQLNKQIKQAKLAGADVSLLTRRYQELDVEIGDATRSAEGFASASGFSANLVAGAKAAVATTAAVGGLAAGVVTLTTVTNQATAEQNALAKSYGMSIQEFTAWGAVAAGAGLNAENTGDLVEELSNKFGEFKSLGEQGTVSDVFGALGVDAAMLEGMSAVEQFEFIMKRLEAVGDIQQASSLADMLFGGEGAKIVTYLKNSGKSLDSIFDKQKKINNLTQEGADGATAYNTSYTALTTAMTSSWQEVAGVVGGEVAPVVDDLALRVSAFAREHKKEIVDFLTAAVNGSLAFGGAVVDLGGYVDGLAQSIGGWDTVMSLVIGMMAGKGVMAVGTMGMQLMSMVKTLGTVKATMLGVNAVMAANPIGAVAVAVGALVAAGVALYQNWEEIEEWAKPFFDWIYGMWEGLVDVAMSVKDAFTWDDDEKKPAPKTTGYAAYSQQSAPAYQGYGYGNLAARVSEIDSETAPAGKGNTVHQNVEKIEIVTQPGQSNQEIGGEVANQLSNKQEAAMYDTNIG